MPAPLLTTKFYFPPTRPNLVMRPRLTERLDEGIKVPLTLVSAPAGYGKTTLLSEWRAGVGRDVQAVWLSLDDEDNDPSHFWFNLTAALENMSSGVVSNTISLLQSPQPLPSKTIATTLLSDLDIFPNDLVLILDDYHLIENGDIQQGLAFLLDHLPFGIHLVILTRADPLLPLSRLRARGHLVEIRAEHLRFTPHEAAAFLNDLMGFNLSEEDITALEKRTEGWITGLQLAALSMEGREDVGGFIAAFTGGHHYIVDYLTDEVLNQQNERMREFLLQTAILRRMNGPLCDALTGRTDGQTILDELERANLFVASLDDERSWYRYHRLFAEVLGTRMRQRQSDEYPRLHRRAADWLAENDFAAEAIYHALSAGDYEYAAQVIETYAASMLMRGEMITLLKWLQSVEVYVRLSPSLSISKAWALAFTGQLEIVEHLIRDAERQAISITDLDENTAQILRGDLPALRAYTAAISGEAQQAIKYGRMALEFVPADNRIVHGVINLTLGGAYWTIGEIDEAIKALQQAFRIGEETGSIHLIVSALCALGNLSMLRGDLRGAADFYMKAIQFASGDNRQTHPSAADAYLGLGNLYYERNDLKAAEGYLENGLQMSRLLGRISTLVSSMISLARMHRTTGDVKQASELLQEVQSNVGNSILNQAVDSSLVVEKINLWLAVGDVESAARLVESRESRLKTLSGINHYIEYPTVASVLLAKNEVEKAMQIADLLLHAAERAGWKKLVIQSLILKALILNGQGEIQSALENIELALSLAEPQGYVRVFLDQGARMEDLLHKVHPRSSAGEYAREMLHAISGRTLESLPDLQSLVDPLSERELEVLRHVAAGKSNRQIAEDLFLATGTVKKHISNISSKLNAQNRTQCVARARELGLL
jgi:LuxR family maltose regulon positive regulatory protein